MAVTLSAAAAGFLYLYFVDPSTSPFASPCLFTAIFGVHCPGCGSLRALHALAHGDLKAALESNKPLVCILPPAGVLFLFSFLRKSPSSSPPSA
jgi:Protein of unknown function (DUF2752)